MKRTAYTTNRCRTCPAYPNAADKNYFTRKATEILAAIASGMGFITAMTFLLILA